MTSNVTMLSATEQAALIRSRELSARELLDATLAKLDAINPTINAVVVTQREAAIERATRADDEAANGRFDGPLHGLPVTVKEVIDWVGTPSTWGVPELANYLPERNAVVVDRLLEAGAILYGKTNVPIMLGEWQAHNEIYGTTNNPWDLTRTLTCIALRGLRPSVNVRGDRPRRPRISRPSGRRRYQRPRPDHPHGR